VHEAVFADVEITAAGAASPVVGQAFGDVVLKSVNAGETAFLHRLHFVVDAALFVVQGL
jgi:hypothetical protein